MIAARIAAAGNTAERTSRIYRVALIIARYRVERHGEVWRINQIERGELLPATYASEALATAGAHLHAACDIDELYDEAEGR